MSLLEITEDPKLLAMIETTEQIIADLATKDSESDEMQARIHQLFENMATDVDVSAADPEHKDFNKVVDVLTTKVFTTRGAGTEARRKEWQSTREKVFAWPPSLQTAAIIIGLACAMIRSGRVGPRIVVFNYKHNANKFDFDQYPEYKAKALANNRPLNGWTAFYLVWGSAIRSA